MEAEEYVWDVWIHLNWQWFPVEEVISCMEFIGHLPPPTPHSGWAKSWSCCYYVKTSTQIKGGSILPIFLVFPNTNSPHLPFRDSRHPTSSLLPVDLLKKNGSELVHVAKWRGLIGWFFLLFLLFIKISYIVYFPHCKRYLLVHSRKVVK